MDLKQFIRIIPDYPQPGVRFKDITTLLQDGVAYQQAINQMKEKLQGLSHRSDCWT